MRVKKEKNIKDGYGVNIEDKLSQMLSEELSKSIDREILKGLGVEPDRWNRRKKSIEKIFKS